MKHPFCSEPQPNCQNPKEDLGSKRKRREKEKEEDERFFAEISGEGMEENVGIMADEVLEGIEGTPTGRMVDRLFSETKRIIRDLDENVVDKRRNGLKGIKVHSF